MSLEPQPWPYDENADWRAGQLIEYAAALQRKYRSRRMAWARKIGRPYASDIPEPDPGVLDAVDEEQG